MSPALSFALATDTDATELQSLRAAVAQQLTAQFGKGHWSAGSTRNGVLFGMRYAKVLLLRDGAELIATLRLATKKPWAIDASYFTPVTRPLYLMDMAVLPARQKSGIGRAALTEAARLAREWPADALRLDAYDAPAGAGEFYAHCGYRHVGRNVYRGTPLLYYELVLSSPAPAE